MDFATSSSGDPKEVSCQCLVATHPVCHGWLRRKTALHQLGSKMEERLKFNRKTSIVNRIAWPQWYIVLSDSVLYVFASETSKQAHKLIHLKFYNRIVSADEERTNDVLWPFKLEPIHQENEPVKVQYFSASSESDFKRWQIELRNEMKTQIAPNIQVKDAGRGPRLWTTSAFTSFSSKESQNRFQDDKSMIDKRPLPAPPGSNDASRQLGQSTRPKPPHKSDPVAAAMWDGSPEEANGIMVKISENGVFLLRRASDGSNGYTLLVIVDGQPCKFKVPENKQTHKLSLLDKVEFESLPQLVRFYSKNNLPRKSIPLSRPYSEFMAENDLEYEF